MMLWDDSYKESKFGSAETGKVGSQKRGGGVVAAVLSLVGLVCVVYGCCIIYYFKLV
jgi:hypothetical protein